MAPEIGQDTTNTQTAGRFRSIPVVWLVAAALLAGILLGRALPGMSQVGAQEPVNDATATRTAELVELNDLRTKVAQPAVCTPAATETPTATATPSATNTPEPTATPIPVIPMGTEIASSTGLVFTFLSIDSITVPSDVDADGMLVRIVFKVRNDSNSDQRLPINEWRLVDSNGNEYKADTSASSSIDGQGWSRAIFAHESYERSLIFDVKADAGTKFTLIDKDDKLFKAALEILPRG